MNPARRRPVATGMATLAGYLREPDAEARSQSLQRAEEAVRRQRDHLAWLLAAEAVLRVREQVPDAARLTFSVADDGTDTGTAALVAVFDAAGTLLWSDRDSDSGVLERETRVDELLAAAVEQGGADFFGAPGRATSPLLDGGATHGLAVAEVTAARADDTAQAVLAGLNLCIHPADPRHDDRSDHVVLDVLGVRVGVRHAATDTVVTLHTERIDDPYRPLLVEIDHAGEAGLLHRIPPWR